MINGEGSRDPIADIVDNYGFLLSKFIANNSSIILFAIFLGILAFGYELFNFTLSIDDEGATFARFSELSSLWIQQGRWSNYFIFKLFLRESLIPYLPTFVSIFFLVVSCLLFFVVVEGDNLSKAIFCCGFMTFPSNAFFMEFNTNFGISIGVASVIAAYIFLIKYFDNNKKLYLFMSIVVTAFGIGVYQSIISIWFCVMFLHLLSCMLDKKNINYRELFKKTSVGITSFAMSLLLYKVIDYTFKTLLKIDHGNYLDTYVGWKDDNILLTIKLIVKNYIIENLTGNSFYGEKTILTIWIGVALLLMCITKIKSIRTKLIGVALIFLVMVSPFIPSLALGFPLPIRSLVGLPLMVGGLLYVSAINVKKSLRYLLLTISILMVIYNSFSITRLFYSDHLNSQADRDLANRILDRVSLLEIDFGKEPIPIAFIGERNRGNLAFIKSEVFGSSFFQFGGPNQYRIWCFLRTLGVENFIYPSNEQLNYAILLSKDMKKWPNKESIQYKEGVVIIKLGEPTDKQLTRSEH